MGLLQKLDQSEGMSTPPFARIRQIELIETFAGRISPGQKPWTLPFILASFGGLTGHRTTGTLCVCLSRYLNGLLGGGGLGARLQQTGPARVPGGHPVRLDAPASPKLAADALHRRVEPRPIREVHDWPSWVPDFWGISWLVNRPVLLHSYAPYQARKRRRGGPDRSPRPKLAAK